MKNIDVVSMTDGSEAPVSLALSDWVDKAYLMGIASTCAKIDAMSRNVTSDGACGGGIFSVNIDAEIYGPDENGESDWRHGVSYLKYVPQPGGYIALHQCLENKYDGLDVIESAEINLTQMIEDFVD